MGFFNRHRTEEDYQTLADSAILANKPVAESLLPWGGYDIRVVTMMARLGHLIYRLEARPHPMTASAAAWYLEYSKSVEVTSTAMQPLNRLRNRLITALDGYKARGGIVDKDKFGNLAKFGPEPRILYGKMFLDDLYPDTSMFGTPRGDVSYVISNYCWKQTSSRD